MEMNDEDRKLLRDINDKLRALDQKIESVREIMSVMDNNDHDIELSGGVRTEQRKAGTGSELYL